MDHIKREAQKNLKIGLYASPDSKAMGHGPCLCKFKMHAPVYNQNTPRHFTHYTHTVPFD